MSPCGSLSFSPHCLIKSLLGISSWHRWIRPLHFLALNVIILREEPDIIIKWHVWKKMEVSEVDSAPLRQMEQRSTASPPLWAWLAGKSRKVILKTATCFSALPTKCYTWFHTHIPVLFSLRMCPCVYIPIKFNPVMHTHANTQRSFTWIAPYYS